jgi:uncharacterized membrane protein
MSNFRKELVFAYHFIWRHYLITIAASVLLIHALRVILAYVFLNVGTAQILTIMWSLATVAAILRGEYVNYTKSYYASTCSTIGTNTFLPSKVETNRNMLIMPFEVTFDLNELFRGDPSLWGKFQDAMAKSNNTYVDSSTVITHGVVDFLVHLANDRPEFMRRIVSKVSSVVTISNWGEATHDVKSSNRDIIERESPFDDSFGTAPELLSNMFVSLARI